MNKKNLSVKPGLNIFKNKTKSCQGGWMGGLHEEQRLMQMPSCIWVKNGCVSLLTGPNVQQNST